eukprot:g21924.t1
MRVVNVNATLDPVNGGGTAERTFQLSRFLSRHGVDCTTLTMDIGINDQRRNDLDGGRLLPIPCLNERFFVPRSGWKQIRDAVAECDLVHVMGHWTILNALTIRAARQTNTPYVSCLAGALPVFGRSLMLKRGYDAFCGRRNVRDADAWIAISPDEFDYFADYGVDRSDVVHIPNGIDEDALCDTDAAAFRKKLGLGDAPFVLYVGRLFPIKGPDLLVEAFTRCAAEFPDHHLVLVGPDGGMQAGLEETARTCGLSDRVHFAGYLGGVEKSRAFHAADLLAIPSRHEAMSIVVLESGITSTPVLLTDRCGFDEVDDVGGGKVVPADVSGLEQGLRTLLSDPSALARRGERLHEFTARNYRWDTIAEKHIKVFERVLSSKYDRPYVLQGRGIDHSLNTAGQLQAKAVAGFLANLSLGQVYSSGMRRAIETATAIADHHKLGVNPIDDLAEVDVGGWEGMSWEAIMSDYPDQYRDFMSDPAAHAYFGGESYSDVHLRVKPILDGLLEQHLGSAIAVVAHNVVNRVYLADLLGIELRRAKDIRQTNSGVNVIRFRDGETELLTLNAHFHLADQEFA